MHVDTHEWYEFLVVHHIVTEDELDLVTDVAGYNVSTMEAVLYSRTGYRTMEQFLGEDDED